MFLLHCPAPTFSAPCTPSCWCDPHLLDPVCGSDGLMYLSPCLAGCTETAGNTSSNNNNNYYNTSL